MNTGATILHRQGPVSAVWQFPPDLGLEGTGRPASPLRFNKHLVSDNFLRTLFSKDSPECFKQVRMSPLWVCAYILQTPYRRSRVCPEPPLSLPPCTLTKVYRDTAGATPQKNPSPVTVAAEAGRLNINRLLWASAPRLNCSLRVHLANTSLSQSLAEVSQGLQNHHCR